MKKRTASDIVQIEGLPVTRSLWSATVDHPLFKAGKTAENIANGSAYPDTTDSHSKGDVKRVTQFATDEAMTDIVDDGYTKDRDRQVSLRYAGKMLRWLSSDLTDDQEVYIKSLRGYELLNKAEDIKDKLVKLVLTSFNAANVEIDIADYNTFVKDLYADLDSAVTFTSNKLQNIKNTSEKDEPVRKYGIKI